MSNSSLKKMHQFVLSRRFDSGFGLDLMVKDLGNAKAMTSELDLSAPLSDRCIEIWQQAAVTLGRGLDHTEVVKALEIIDSASPRAG